MAIDDRYRPDLYDKARQAFEKSARTKDFKLPPEKIDQAVKIAQVKDRAARLTQKAQAHHARRAPQAVQREFKKLMREHPLKASNDLARGPKAPGLGPSREQMHREQMMHRAEKKVRLNHLKRLDSIDRAQARMTRKITLSRDRQIKRAR